MSKGEELLNKFFDNNDKLIGEVFNEYNKSAYCFCKKYDLLYENSAEEFSIAWMTWWNKNSDYDYY